MIKSHSAKADDKFNCCRTEKGYPLRIEKGAEVLIEESPVDRNLVLKMLPKIDYEALLGAAKFLREEGEGIPELPATLPENMEQSLAEETIAKYHKVLFDIHMINGFLICPDTGRKFPVKDGIPNMILHEDEL